MEEDGGSEDAVKFLVQKLSALLELHKKKMWLIGATANYETYRKFLDRFPSLEVEWDLHPLPITSTRSSVGELSSKSRLQKSIGCHQETFHSMWLIAQAVGIMGTPCVQFFKNKEILRNVPGVKMKKEYKEFIEANKCGRHIQILSL